MSTWEQQLASIRKLREARNAGYEKVYANRNELLKINKRLDELRRQPAANAANEIGQLEQRKGALEQELSRNKNLLNSVIKDLHTSIVGVYVDPHPRRLTANLDDNIPFLLLPVRIETRFMTQLESPELWLRIYPDDIAIHTHEKWLTPVEVDNGQAYWKNLFDAEKTGGEDKENMRRSAWTNITTKFGSQRSSWVARQTKPTNWNNIAVLAESSQLIFPVNDTTTENWSNAPRTNVLPDKFVVTLYKNNVVAKEAIGKAIPDELKIGPDPLDPDAAFQTVDNKLVFGEDYDWTSDFDKAVEAGMGIKIPLSPDETRGGFDKVMVLGLSLSMNETETKQAIETLIDNHHYSPNGFSIVKQGTPTNNTEQDGSGFSSNDPFNAESYFTETGDPLFNDGEEKDARFLADALGISYEPLQNILHADSRDRKNAEDMNIALYPSTLGYYFDTMLKPAVDEETQNTIRDFFTKHVTAMGPCPAIRVGNQPYGVLLTSDFSKWVWDNTDRMYSAPFLNGLLHLLRHYDGIWKSLVPQVAFTGKPGSDPSAILMSILGLQPGSVSFHQRVGFDHDDLKTRDEFINDGRYADDYNAWESNSNLLWTFLKNNGALLEDVDGVHQFPQLLQLIFRTYLTTINALNPVDKVPVSEKQLLTNYDEDAKKNYIHWLSEKVSALELEKQDFGTAERPNALLYQQLRRALLLQIYNSSVHWFNNQYGIVLNQASGPVNFYNIRPEPTLTKWETIKAKISVADANHLHANMEVGEYLQTQGINETDASFLKKMKESLQRLALLETAKLERCLTDHIDTLSYRLDAWQAAIFKLRLDKQRRSAAGDQGRALGSYLGCFGYVENLRPEPRFRAAAEVSEAIRRITAGKPLLEFINNGGFVHAPSLNHALAAALLRSGYLNHANAANPEILSVNLSSERIRRAMFILEGIRNGQRIEALLGYQFERGMHDRASANTALSALNEYIYAFRDKFTIEQHYVLQEGTTESETIPASNVVNGLTLAENGDAYPYSADLPANPTPSGLKDAVIAEKSRLNDTLDAIKDLFMSESVYQLVQGNFDRAGAVLTALKDTNIPPEIEMIQTPRSSHFGFTNRVTVQFENTSTNPWDPIPMTAKARTEPGMNKWIAGMIGNPAELFCNVSPKSGSIEAEPLIITFASLNLQPIDLAYISLAELQIRIAFAYRRARTLSDDTPIIIEFGNMAAVLSVLEQLKILITDCRPLDAGDFLPSYVSFEAGSTNDNAELGNRVNTMLGEFNGKLSQVRSIPIIVESNPSSLGVIFDVLDQSGVELVDIDFEFTAVDNLQLVLTSIAEWGLPDCFPVRSQAADDGGKMALLTQALNVIRQMTNVAGQATEKIASVIMPEPIRITNTLIEAGKLLLGASFTLLPKFNYSNPDDIRLSHTDSSLLAYAKGRLAMDLPADEWMHSVSHVRPRLHKWESVRLLTELNGRDVMNLEPVQVPFRSNDSWIAIEFPAERSPGVPFTIDRDTLSVVIHGDTAFDTAAKQSGLLIDDWTETIPLKEEITGVAFNYDQPASMPAQAVLLAVTPEQNGHWSWDDLLGIINDTFVRAKQRAVDPDLLNKLNNPQTGVLLPALLASFSQYDVDFDLDFRLAERYFADNAPILSVMG